MRMQYSTMVLLAGMATLLSQQCLGDKNPSGDFFKNGMPQATQGESTAAETGNNSTPPPGWDVSKPLPVSSNVRHDLHLTSWTITDVKTGTVAGHWDWDSQTQNFRGKYSNGAIDVLRFDEWNNPGRIVLTGFNNLGLRVQFVGELRANTAEGTATAFVPGNPFVWQWRADTGNAQADSTNSAAKASPSSAADSQPQDNLSKTEETDSRLNLSDFFGRGEEGSSQSPTPSVSKSVKDLQMALTKKEFNQPLPANYRFDSLIDYKTTVNERTDGIVDVVAFKLAGPHTAQSIGYRIYSTKEAAATALQDVTLGQSLTDSGDGYHIHIPPDKNMSETVCGRLDSRRNKELLYFLRCSVQDNSTDPRIVVSAMVTDDDASVLGNGDGIGNSKLLLEIQEMQPLVEAAVGHLRLAEATINHETLSEQNVRKDNDTKAVGSSTSEATSSSEHPQPNFQAGHEKTTTLEWDNSVYEDHDWKAGLEFVSKGEYRQAIDSFTRSIERLSAFSPDIVPSVYYQARGTSYYKAGDYAQAVSDFSEAVRLNPNDPELADLLATAGKKLLESAPQ